MDKLCHHFLAGVIFGSILCLGGRIRINPYGQPDRKKTVFFYDYPYRVKRVNRFFENDLFLDTLINEQLLTLNFLETGDTGRGWDRYCDAILNS